MEITNVRIRKIENKNRLKAIATITFNDCFVVHELRLIDGANGLFVAMPSKKNNRDEYKDICHPITQELREEIEGAIIKSYNELE